MSHSAENDAWDCGHHPEWADKRNTCHHPDHAATAEKNARCSRCDEVVGKVVTEQGRATVRLSTSSHGDTLPISCPNAFRPGGRSDG